MFTVHPTNSYTRTHSAHNVQGTDLHCVTGMGWVGGVGGTKQALNRNVRDRHRRVEEGAARGQGVGTLTGDDLWRQVTRVIVHLTQVGPGSPFPISHCDTLTADRYHRSCDAVCQPRRALT